MASTNPRRALQACARSVRPGVMKGDTAKWRSVVADERWILREVEVFSHGSQTLILESRARCVTVPLVSTFQSTTSGAPVTPWPPRIESCSCLRFPPKHSNRRRRQTFTTTRTPRMQRIGTCKPRQRNVPSSKADSQSPPVSSTVRTALHRSHRSRYL